MSLPNLPLALSRSAAASVTDHGALTGLTDDDHPQYLLLAGRAGTTNDALVSTSADGSIYGSELSTGSLILRANNEAQALTNTGRVVLNDGVSLWPGIPDITGGVTITGTLFSPTGGITLTGTAGENTLNIMQFTPTMALTTTGGVVLNTVGGIEFSPTATISASGGGVQVATFRMLQAKGSHAIASSGQFLTFEALRFTSNVSTSAAGGLDNATIRQVVDDTTTFTGSGVTTTLPTYNSFRSNPAFTSFTVGDAFTLSAVNHFHASMPVTATGTITVTARRGLLVDPITTGGAGTINVTTEVGVDIGTLTGTTALSLRSSGSSVAMRHAGPAIFGANEAPISTLSVGTGSLFRVAGADGDLERIKDVPYDWPSANAAGYLRNNGAGALSWDATGAGIDHGGLTGLLDDDHTQYYLTAGTREMTSAFFDRVNADPGVDRLWIDDGTVTVNAGTLVFGNAATANEAVFFENVAVGNPGLEQNNYVVAGVAVDALLKINHFGTATTTNVVIHTHSTTLPPSLVFLRTNVNTESHASGAVVNGTSLGLLTFAGWDGTDYAIGAFIEALVDGTPGANDIPTALRLMVSPDGTQVPTERVRVNPTVTSLQDLLSLRGTFTTPASGAANTQRAANLTSAITQSNNNSRAQCYACHPALTMSSATGSRFTAMHFEPSGTLSNGGHIVRCVAMAGTLTFDTAGGATSLFTAEPTLTANSGVFAPPSLITYDDLTTVQSAGVAAGSTSTVRSFAARPTITCDDTAAWTISAMTGFDFAPSLVNEDAGAALTITTLRGVSVANPAVTGTPTITTFEGINIANLTVGTTNISIRSTGETPHMRHVGALMFGTDATPDTTNGNILELQRTHTLTAGVADGQAACYVSDPGYTGAFTVTRHNYWKVENVSVAASAAVTDSCVMWFDAAAGTHSAVSSHTGAGTPTLGVASAPVTGDPDAWVKINVNGTVMRIPAWA